MLVGMYGRVCAATATVAVAERQAQAVMSNIQARVAADICERDPTASPAGGDGDGDGDNIPNGDLIASPQPGQKHDFSSRQDAGR